MNVFARVCVFTDGQQQQRLSTIATLIFSQVVAHRLELDECVLEVNS